MAGRLLFHIVSGILGLYLAQRFVPGVDFHGSIKTLFIIGVVLGLVNFLIKPVLNAIAFPLRILTLGLFSLIINMLLVWVVADIFFPRDFEINGILALFWTTLIIWVLNFFFGLYGSGRRKAIVEE
jgi:putative membrane protein